MTRLPLTILFATTALLAQGPNTCASADAAGNLGNSGSFRPKLSADGRYCAFTSSASNLVPADTNGDMDAFVKDRATGAITRVSVASNGAQGNGASSDVAITPDGRYVAFVTRASFSPFDGNGLPDVYRHDRTTGQTLLASCSALGLVGNDGSSAVGISDDGRLVVFRSLATNLVPGDGNGCTDIFVKDLHTSVVEVVSNASTSVWGNRSAGWCVISGDGRFVAFDSHASNLVANDTNGCEDVFVRDRQTGVTRRVSVAANGVQSNGPSHVLDIATSGSRVVYRSWASNLVPGDTNGAVDVFAADPLGGSIERVSVATSGLQADGASMEAAISGDGRFVAFASRAANLVAGDFNQADDVYLRDRQAGTTVRASRSLGGGSPSGACTMPAIGDDADLVAFSTYAPDTLASGTNASDQVVVADLAPAVPATFTTFGQGCQGTNGVPALDRDERTLPWTGTTLRLEGWNVQGGTFGILAFGFSDTSWNGMPLPAPLAGFGMGACTLFTSVDLSVPVFAQANGTWSHAFGVPAGAGWLGVAMHTQGWWLDPWANALGATVSNAATMVFGG